MNKWPYSMDRREDPVARLVRDLTAEEMVDWLIEYQGLAADRREVVVTNLREQYRWHRLQGRLDQKPALAVYAELRGLRRSPMTLETPKKPEPMKDMP